MFHFDSITEKSDNNWPYRTLFIGPSGSGKTNFLLNLIQQDNNVIDKVDMYAKDLEEQKTKISAFN